VLRGRVGDSFEIFLINDGTVDHGIDFHAAALAPDRPCAPSLPACGIKVEQRRGAGQSAGRYAR
jgi:hypothetical protein